MPSKRTPEEKMTEAAKQSWNRWRIVLIWVLVEQVLPGATLFVLLLWLSQRYLREGFRDVRQSAFAPDTGKVWLAAPVRRNWWSCTCGAIGACRCVGAIACGLRQCCVKVLQLNYFLNGTWVALRRISL